MFHPVRDVSRPLGVPLVFLATTCQPLIVFNVMKSVLLAPVELILNARVVSDSLN